MSTQEKKLYKDITVKGNKRPAMPAASRAYRGISTTNPENTGFNLYDIALIKQDIIINSEGANLAGTIYRPKNAYASVVVVHGSGQEIRMTKFAELLANNGISVLTYDKRGVGKSGGVYAGPEVGTNNVDSLNINLLAKDARSALNKIKKRGYLYFGLYMILLYLKNDLPCQCHSILLSHLLSYIQFLEHHLQLNHYAHDAIS